MHSAESMKFYDVQELDLLTALCLVCFCSNEYY